MDFIPIDIASLVQQASNDDHVGQLQSNCPAAARFAMRRRARPFEGSLFCTSPNKGKGNKAEALRLRSGDTGLMSLLGSAL